MRNRNIKINIVVSCWQLYCFVTKININVCVCQGIEKRVDCGLTTRVVCAGPAAVAVGERRDATWGQVARASRGAAKAERSSSARRLAALVSQANASRARWRRRRRRRRRRRGKHQSMRLGPSSTSSSTNEQWRRNRGSNSRRYVVVADYNDI